MKYKRFEIGCWGKALGGISLADDKREEKRRMMMEERERTSIYTGAKPGAKSSLNQAHIT